ncbi:MAG: hypothetical protein KIT80_05875 [Chitinophagaceae bacterium]|nr:hypothetical protein [Chitinophagaceae bacterium]MCW5926421.1 hypothetical protein [Chitinophagaceae bacterium]
MGQINQKLENRARRIFPEALKKQIVKGLVHKRPGLQQVVLEHQVSRT